MSEKTTIPWTDSTLNLQMGCASGCELWTSKVRKCYAGLLTEKYAGLKGWPASFDKPEIFPARMNEVESWSDLTGKARPDKSWIPSEFPRLIFLNDMGDTFTERLPLDWLNPYIPRMAKTPHVYQMLTKRPSRMLKFWQQYGPVPDNFWLGVSITDQKSVKRLIPLLEIDFDGVIFISLEPMIEPVDLRFPRPSTAARKIWVIVGGESGERPFDPDWARDVLRQCREVGANFFMKQLGGVGDRRERMSDFPQDLRIREFPEWKPAGQQMGFGWL